MKRLHCAAALALSLGLAAAPSHAQTLTQPLSPSEVACNEAQLGALLGRMAVTNPAGGQTGRPSTLFVTYSNQFGFYEGLAVSNQSPLIGGGAGEAAQSEHFLAFHLNPSVRTLLTNPARPQLEQISLQREDASSNYVPPGSTNALVVTLNPTLGQGGGESDLRINNFSPVAVGQAYNGFISSSSRPGRGLVAAGLTSLCHADFTGFDRRVFAILQRVLRVELGQGLRNEEIAIYRGSDEQTYRIDIYVLGAGGAGAPLGKVALELEVQADATGGLIGGELRALPPCAGGQTSGCSDAAVPVRVWILPPVFGGTEVRQDGGPSTSLLVLPGTSPAPVLVDWSAILAGTTWITG